MSRTPRLLPALLALALGASACSAGPDTNDAGRPAYEKSDSVQARALPQLASSGDDPEAAADAAWVVDATVEGVDEGTSVTLFAQEGEEWSEVDDQETDDEGHAALTTTDDGTLHVVVGDGEDAIGTEVSTADAPAASFTDDFDEDSVDTPDGIWQTRDQGYTGVRTCSRADTSATEVADGVLTLSVTEDPDRDGETCKLPGRRKRYPYRLNGHVGTEAGYSFTYGYAAARVRMQADRGQHSSFWLQSVGGQKPLGAKEGGAEIDVIEYFGDDHPEGGLTSFTYFLDENGKKQTVGGWLPDVEDLGDDWSEQYHVFSVEWTPDEYVFRIDGRVTQRLEGETSGQPEFLILSLLSSDYELPRSDGELPETMEVDWARVWETGPDAS